MSEEWEDNQLRMKCLAQGQQVSYEGHRMLCAVPVATIQSEQLWLLSEPPGAGLQAATTIWPELTCREKLFAIPGSPPGGLGIRWHLYHPGLGW